MAMFFKLKYLTEKKDEEKCAVPATELMLVLIAYKNVVKGLKDIDVGMKARDSFLPSALHMNENEKKLRIDSLQTYQKTTVFEEHACFY